LTAKEIINQIANDREYYTLCGKLAPNFKDDLFQELMVILLEYDKDKIFKLYCENKIRFFVVKILMNQACSNTSPFFKKYRMRINYADIDWHDEQSIPDELIHATTPAIQSYSKENDNNWYRTELFMQYIKEGSIRKLSAKTGIPPMSINRSLIEFKREIKTKIHEHITNITE